MNYSDKPVELPARYQAAPETTPQPPSGSAVNPEFLWDLIFGKLLRSLDPFPDAREAYVETLRILRQQYAPA